MHAGQGLKLSLNSKVNKTTSKSILLFYVLLICYLFGFFYFGNLAIFNIWQSSFSNKEEILSILTFRFWLFGLLSLVCLIAFIAQVIIKVKKVNRKYRKTQALDDTHL
jgi:glucan phosphoethanolaminetransferase (alkaline phosphatase superfamily)